MPETLTQHACNAHANTSPLTCGGYIDRLTRFTEYFFAARHQPQIITGVLRERQIRPLIKYKLVCLR